jgi:hypothetical protein
MSDIQGTNMVIEGECSPVTFGEFWHLCPDERAFAGPFATKEAAEADAFKYLQDEGGRYGIDAVAIVKTVSRGRNTVTVETNFYDA